VTDILIEKILKTSNPTCVGLDTAFEYLPENMRKFCRNFSDVGKAFIDYNVSLIDKLKDVIPAVKVQAAYYEMYGPYGAAAYFATLREAKKAGLVVIADAKRNDIGSTAACYSKAYLGETEVNGVSEPAFPSDYLTVNGYLGSDGIEPFLADCKRCDKGIFVLVKTSNPSSGQFQNRRFASGETLYEAMGALVEEWGSASVGKYGYSDVGAVVGATHPEEAAILRELMPHTFFLIPGYGAQGGKADDLAVCFDARGLGGIVNNSRGILCANKSEKYKGMNYLDAARAAVLDMREDIALSLSRRKI